MRDTAQLENVRRGVAAFFFPPQSLVLHKRRRGIRGHGNHAPTSVLAPSVSVLHVQWRPNECWAYSWSVSIYLFIWCSKNLYSFCTSYRHKSFFPPVIYCAWNNPGSSASSPSSLFLTTGIVDMGLKTLCIRSIRLLNASFTRPCLWLCSRLCILTTKLQIWGLASL